MFDEPHLPKGAGDVINRSRPTPCGLLVLVPHSRRAGHRRYRAGPHRGGVPHFANRCAPPSIAVRGTRSVPAMRPSRDLWRRCEGMTVPTRGDHRLRYTRSRDVIPPESRKMWAEATRSAYEARRRRIDTVAAAVALQRRLEQRMRDGVMVARRRGASWADIGWALGLSRQAVWHRYHRSVTIAGPPRGASAPARVEGALLALQAYGLRADGLDRHLRNLVRQARARGQSWAAIGTDLGIARQTAWERFGMPGERECDGRHQPIGLS
jgi:hypothetical protein